MSLMLRIKRQFSQRIWSTIACAAIACAAIATARGNTETQSSDSREADDLASSIVEKADQVRFPKEGFEVNVTITTASEDGASEPRKYRVMSKGNENTIVITTEPASDRGQILLTKGRDLWMFIPTVSQPVRLSMAQRLTGLVSNGDIAKANFSGDYRAKLLRTENLGGEPHYVLELTSVDRGVTYHRVVLWVRQSNYWPQRAEFYAVSDRLLKTCFYENFKTMAGRLRPTRLVMRDALKKGEESVLEYADMRFRDLPDKVFTKDYLKRLE